MNCATGKCVNQCFCIYWLVFKGISILLKKILLKKKYEPLTKLIVYLLARRESTHWVISGHLKYLKTLCIAFLFSAVYKSLKKTNGSEGKNWMAVQKKREHYRGSEHPYLGSFQALLGFPFFNRLYIIWKCSTDSFNRLFHATVVLLSPEESLC